jgi:hypothetical protein
MLGSDTSLRPSAYLSALCGEITVTAETAEIRREGLFPRIKTRHGKRNLSAASAYLSALCGEITVTAEARGDTQRHAERGVISKDQNYF